MLQIREAVRVGMPLEDALDKHAHWARHTIPDATSSGPVDQEAANEAAKRARARQNDASLRALQGIMGGVK